jgi:hypothetical protein
LAGVDLRSTTLVDGDAEDLAGRCCTEVRYVEIAVRAKCHTGGNREPGQWLNRAYVVRSPFLISISTEPKWKAMIGRPGLEAFLAKMTPQEHTQG